MSIPLYEINLSNNIMKTILVNICGHDVTHDFNSGEVSTKRLLRLKKLIHQVFNIKGGSSNSTNIDNIQTAINNYKPEVESILSMRNENSNNISNTNVNNTNSVISANSASSIFQESEKYLMNIKDVIDIEYDDIDVFISNISKFIKDIPKEGMITRNKYSVFSELKTYIEEMLLFKLGETNQMNDSNMNNNVMNVNDNKTNNSKITNNANMNSNNRPTKKQRQSGGNKVLTYNYVINLLKKQTYILEDSTMSNNDFNVLKENIILHLNPMREYMYNVFQQLCNTNQDILPMTIYASSIFHELIAIGIIYVSIGLKNYEEVFNSIFIGNESPNAALVAQENTKNVNKNEISKKDPNSVANMFSNNYYGGANRNVDIDQVYNRFYEDGVVKPEFTEENLDFDKVDFLFSRNGDIDIKGIRDAPNNHTKNAYIRTLSSKRRAISNELKQSKYMDYIGKFLIKIQTLYNEHNIKISRQERKYEKIELGKDLDSKSKTSVNTVSQSLVTGVLSQLDRPSPTSNVLENKFVNLQYDILEKVSNKGQTSTIDKTLMDNFRNIFKDHISNDPLSYIQNQREKPSISNNTLYRKFDTINNASMLEYLYGKGPHTSYEKYTACPMSSLVDAMSHCSFKKAQKDNKLVLHDMAFTIKDVNSYEQYSGYSTLKENKNGKNIANVGFHIVLSNKAIVGPTFKNIDLVTGKEIAASSIYKNVLEYLATKHSYLKDAFELIDILQNPKILSEFIACICFKNTGDLFQEINSLLKYQGVINKTQKGNADRFFIGFGNDQPSAVRAMALAKFYKPNSDINEEAFVGFVSTKNKVFLKANSIYNILNQKSNSTSVKKRKISGGKTHTKKLNKKNKNNKNNKNNKTRNNINSRKNTNNSNKLTRRRKYRK